MNHIVSLTGFGGSGNLFQKLKEKETRQKRRSMKSSHKWTTIHFHFEVLWTVLKCDCKWQSQSLLVYHDGYTLPWWRCTHVFARALPDKCMNTESCRAGILRVCVCRHRPTYKIHLFSSFMLTKTQRDKVASDIFLNMFSLNRKIWNSRPIYLDTYQINHKLMKQI